MSKTSKKPTKIMKLVKSAKPAAKKASSSAKVKMKAVKPMKAGKPSHQSLSSPVAKDKGSRRGFMWKALERKQQKQKEQQTHPSVNPEDRSRPTASPQGFARFNGPRRRVG